MKKFLPWLLPMIVLLGSVPVLLIYNVSTTARVAGIILVVFVSVALRFWLYNAGKLKKGKGRVRISINERHTILDFYPSYNRIPAARRNSLEERMGLLLAELSFDKSDHSDVNREECMLFVLVLAFFSEKEPYKNAVDKVVVLSETTHDKLVSQENHPVLFVSEEDLKEFLRQFNWKEGSVVSDDSLTILLSDFYNA